MDEKVLTPNFLSVSFSASNPDITIDTNIEDLHDLDEKMNLVFTRLLEVACIVKKNQWDKYYDERQKAVEEYEKELKNKEKQLEGG